MGTGRTEWRHQQHPEQQYTGGEGDLTGRIETIVRRELKEMEQRLDKSLASRMQGWIKDAVREAIDAFRCASDRTPAAVSPVRRSPEAAPSHPRHVHSSPPRPAAEDFAPSSAQTVHREHSAPYTYDQSGAAAFSYDPQPTEIPMTDAATMAEGIMAQAEVRKLYSLNLNLVVLSLLILF